MKYTLKLTSDVSGARIRIARSFFEGICWPPWICWRSIIRSL